MYRHIKGVELFFLGRELERQKKKKIPAMQERELPTAFSLFGTETGNPKKSSLYLGTGIHGVPISKYTGTRISADVKGGWLGDEGSLIIIISILKKLKSQWGGGGHSGPAIQN